RRTNRMVGSSPLDETYRELVPCPGPCAGCTGPGAAGGFDVPPPGAGGAAGRSGAARGGLAPSGTVPVGAGGAPRSAGCPPSAGTGPAGGSGAGGAAVTNWFRSRFGSRFAWLGYMKETPATSPLLSPRRPTPWRWLMPQSDPTCWLIVSTTTIVGWPLAENASEP